MEARLRTVRMPYGGRSEVTIARDWRRDPEMSDHLTSAPLKCAHHRLTGAGDLSFNHSFINQYAQPGVVPSIPCSPRALNAGGGVFVLTKHACFPRPAPCDPSYESGPGTFSNFPTVLVGTLCPRPAIPMAGRPGAQFLLGLERSDSSSSPIEPGRPFLSFLFHL